MKIRIVILLQTKMIVTKSNGAKKSTRIQIPVKKRQYHCIGVLRRVPILVVNLNVLAINLKSLMVLIVIVTSSESGSKSGSESGSKSCSKSASKSASKSDSKSTSK